MTYSFFLKSYKVGYFLDTFLDEFFVDNQGEIA